MLKTFFFTCVLVSTSAEQPYKLQNEEPPRALDLNLPNNEIDAAVKFSVEHYNADSNSLEKYQPGRVISSVPSNDGKQFDMKMEIQGDLGTSRFVEVQVVKDMVAGFRVQKWETIYTVRFAKNGEKPMTNEEPNPEGLTGGFNPTAKSESPEAKAAAMALARKAGMDGGESVIICDVQTQVVNGMNYKLTLGKGNCDNGNTFKGVVYKPFQGDYQARLINSD
uniref:Cysteine proteinase inhibitor n=1 Tax=Polyblepharides amylifera TaxID=1486889 RepID=A0A7R9XNH5_9CHLO|mmetsp:Transcript_734/g.1063  ORF Transcript_734/g.1063 Transcript_734/m.1063 type:complete len:222 (+) Transcript_734:105-770(+)